MKHACHEKLEHQLHKFFAKISLSFHSICFCIVESPLYKRKKADSGLIGKPNISVQSVS